MKINAVNGISVVNQTKTTKSIKTARKIIQRTGSKYGSNLFLLFIEIFSRYNFVWATNGRPI